GAEDLAQVTLMSDGVSVYECTSADEVVDLLQGGHGVFGIALGRVWREVEGDLAVLRTDEATPDPNAGVSPKLSKYYPSEHQLLESIANLDPGSPAPPERELARTFGMSRAAVRQVLSVLATVGWLQRRQGKATLVAEVGRGDLD